MGYDRHLKTERGPDKDSAGTRGGRKTAKAQSRKLRRSADAKTVRESIAPDRPTRIGRDRWGRAGWLVWIDGVIVARGLATAADARAALAAWTSTSNSEILDP